MEKFIKYDDWVEKYTKKYSAPKEVTSNPKYRKGARKRASRKRLGGFPWTKGLSKQRSGKFQQPKDKFNLSSADIEDYFVDACEDDFLKTI